MPNVDQSNKAQSHVVRTVNSSNTKVATGGGGPVIPLTGQLWPRKA